MIQKSNPYGARRADRWPGWRRRMRAWVKGAGPQAMSLSGSGFVTSIRCIKWRQSILTIAGGRRVVSGVRAYSLRIHVCLWRVCMGTRARRLIGKTPICNVLSGCEVVHGGVHPSTRPPTTIDRGRGGLFVDVRAEAPSRWSSGASTTSPANNEPGEQGRQWGDARRDAGRGEAGYAAFSSR